MVSVTDGDLLSPIDSHASAAMDYNPMFSPNTSQPSSPSSTSTADPRSVPSATADTIQTVNIRSHVPIILELNDPNYTDWRMLFDSTIGKFGLDAFISFLTPVIDRDADWYKVDSCIVNWIYMTCSPEVLRIIRMSKKETGAFSL
jgi:hypothetical protein